MLKRPVWDSAVSMFAALTAVALAEDSVSGKVNRIDLNAHTFTVKWTKNPGKRIHISIHLNRRQLDLLTSIVGKV